MFEFLFYPDSLTSFILVATRVGSILASAPFFGSSAIKTQIKVFLTILVALLIYPGVENVTIENIGTLLLVLLIFKEILIGVCIGILSHFLFIGVQLCGQVAGMQMGLNMARALDPSSDQSLSLISTFLNITMLLIFIAIGGHYYVIGAISESFRFIPLGGGHIEPVAFEYIAKLFTFTFLTAIKIMAPVLMTLLMFSIVIGTIVKFAPQINLMIVGIPIKIVVGITMLLLSMDYFYIVYEKVLLRYFEETANIIRLF
ncbi:MAG: flagellar biosynthetic protein FliR [Denitrovibrio sp.]|nr:MAG: flagellar biosynthetic protein FliR [Denitrovibrio sp.]